MFQISNLHYSIGDRKLISGANWIINRGKRVALIGPNGAGKTTFLRILNGELQIDEGDISAPKGYRIGYLPQEEIAEEMGPILGIVLKGHEELLRIEKEIADIHHQLEANSGNQEALLKKLGGLEDRFELLGGYQIEAEAKAILSGLGFKDTDFQRNFADFSGGWRMRVHLARLLVQKPDLLLLDEPSNHLDLESLEWLEQFLRTFEGSIVIVSHDRFFIDRLAQEICELDRAKLTYYAGNYHFFEKQKALNEAQLFQKWEEQQAERQRLQRFIDRFRYKASKAAQVQSRVKMLEKMEKIELPPPKRHIHFQIQVATSSYKDVLKIEDLYFKYDQDWVLKNIDLNLYRGEKVALVGVNGAGKTTLTRLIFGQLQQQQGNLTVGERVEMGYYAQHQVDTLNLDSSIIDEVAETAAETHRLKLRDILGIFQFSGDTPDKRIGILSGGEKARVSLAKILLSPVNFLIMDEPTNHLDIESQEALEKALQEYDGTLLLISHDRYFLDKLVTRVIEIKDGHVHQYEGGYSDYFEKRFKNVSDTVPDATETPKQATAIPARKTKEQKRQEAELRQTISKERKKLNEEIENSEAKIQELETRKAELETRMAAPQTYQDGDLAAALQKEYSQLKIDLDETVEKWENAQIALEELVAKLDQMTAD